MNLRKLAETQSARSFQELGDLVEISREVQEILIRLDLLSEPIEEGFGQRQMDALAHFQELNLITEPAILGPTTSTILLEKGEQPVQALEIVATKKTSLKKLPLQSDSLDVSDKRSLSKGEKVRVLSFEEERNHLRVVLHPDERGDGRSTWFAFSEHIQVVSDGTVVYPLPVPEKHGVEVPYLSQLDNFETPSGSSNVTALAMALQALGIKPRAGQGQFEDELYRFALEKSLDRHNPRTLLAIANDYGVHAELRRDARMQDIKAWIALGFPVILFGFFTEQGHYLTVTGYDKKGLIVHDPFGEYQPTGYRLGEGKGENAHYPNEIIEELCAPFGTLTALFLKPKAGASNHGMRLEDIVGTEAKLDLRAVKAEPSLAEQIEERLKALGLADDSITDRFGAAALAAYRRFQKLTDCREPGCLGPATAQKLLETTHVDLTDSGLVLTVLEPSILKAKPIQSDSLQGGQQHPLSKGQKLALVSVEAAHSRNHLKLTLRGRKFPLKRADGETVDTAAWYVFGPHIEVHSDQGRVYPAPKSDRVKLAVPYKYQLDNRIAPTQTCNVTSIAMCLEYLGAKRQESGGQFEDELSRFVARHRLNRGSTTDMKKIIEAYDRVDRFTSHATIEMIKNHIAKGYPVIVHGEFTSSGHIIVLVGYDETGFLVHDPNGEWFSTGYDTSPRAGEYAHYSYGMINRLCFVDGTFWAHLVEGGSPPPPLETGPSTAAPISTEAGPSSIGKITPGVVKRMFPASAGPNIDRHLKSVLTALEAQGLTEEGFVLVALSTIRAETEGFAPISEFQSRFNTDPGGRPFGRYDFRPNLGNNGVGMGAMFKGRGFIQLTGRHNYGKYGKAIGLGDELLRNPDKANEPEIASKLLAAFLKAAEGTIKRALDASPVNFVLARKAVNGGTHGLDRFIDAFENGRAALKSVTRG